MTSPGLVRAALLALLALGLGCGASPMAVTAEFWQALADGDVEGAAEWSHDPDLRALARLAERHPIGSVEVGAIQSEGDSALVETRLRRAGEPIEFFTRLHRTDAGWRVDPRASTQALRRAAMQSSVEELRQAFEEGADALGEAARQGLEEASEAIREALDELEAETAPPTGP